MQRFSKAAALAALKGRPLKSALDATCGSGWLKAAFPPEAEVDVFDLYAQPEGHHRKVWQRERLLTWPARIYCQGREKYPISEKSRACRQVAVADAPPLGRHLNSVTTKASAV
jgi:hypothetical protein